MQYRNFKVLCRFRKKTLKKNKLLLAVLPTKILFFFSVLRMARSGAKTKTLEPWKIALIVLAVLVVLAIVIGLLVYFLVYGKYISFPSDVP